MKIIYRNVTQVVEKIGWSKLTKSATNCRTVIFGTCEDLQSKTKVTARIKILTNTTSILSGEGYFGCGDSDTVDHISGFYGGSPSQFAMDFNVGAVTPIEKTIAVTAAQVSDGLDVKFGIRGASAAENNQLASGLTYEIEYFFQ